MSIDPDVQALLDVINARLDALETVPVPEPEPEPEPEPPAPVQPGNAMDIISGLTDTAFTPKVTLPQGFVGAYEEAETVYGPITGETLVNKVIRAGSTPSSGFIVRDCDLVNCTIIGEGKSFNAAVKGDSYLADCLILDVGGDGLKVGDGGESVECYDSIISMRKFSGGPGSSDKHYDGAQGHQNSSMRIVRTVFLWHDLGYYANSTGAIFTQMEASVFARDITILDPGGTYQIVRLHGSGPQDVDRVQVVGVQRETKHGKMAPTAIVKSREPIDTLFNEVPGADDWLKW